MVTYRESGISMIYSIGIGMEQSSRIRIGIGMVWIYCFGIGIEQSLRIRVGMGMEQSSRICIGLNSLLTDTD